MSRNRSGQNKHDAEVRRIAKKYESQGWAVSADIKGYPKPNTLNGFRPDVVAKKGWARKIVEVETPDSVYSARDLRQQSAFRRAAKQSKHTTFKRVVAE